MDPPVTVVDNEIATLTITRFFSYVSNEGTENEKWSFGFEMDVTNNMDEFALNVYENNISLSDQRVISFYYLNSKGYVRSGKTQQFKLVSDSQDNVDVNILYELEGYFDLQITQPTNEGTYKLIETRTVPFSIAEHMGKQSVYQSN